MYDVHMGLSLQNCCNKDQPFRNWEQWPYRQLQKRFLGGKLANTIKKKAILGYKQTRNLSVKNGGKSEVVCT
jgi:hypothetical protein